MTEDLFLSTDMVDPDLRTEFWREVTGPVCDTTPGAGADTVPLEGSVRWIRLGALQIAPTTFNRQHFRRERALILEGALDDYMVQLFIAGTLEGDCGGREVSVGPGDICVYDLARPFATRALQGGTTITVTLPRQRVDAATHGVSLHGTVLQADWPVTRMLGEFIANLAEVGARLDAEDVPAIEEAATTLLLSSLVRHAPAQDLTPAQMLRQRALAFIDANLGDPGLGPMLLMQQFRVSRAHLYRMFAADGGIANLVRERRLDAAFRQLRRGGNGSQSITGIALELGFSSSGQFLRAFRSRFDMTPSEARGEAASSATIDPHPAAMRALLCRYARRSRGVLGPDPKTAA